jgi:hypothetical protein
MRLKNLFNSIFVFILFLIIIIIYHPFVNPIGLTRLDPKDKNIQPKVIIKNYNPIFPEIAIVYKLDSDERQKSDSIVNYIKLIRSGLSTFEQDTNYSYLVKFTTYNYDQIIDIVNKTDFRKSNPDEAHILAPCFDRCSNTKRPTNKESDYLPLTRKHPDPVILSRFNSSLIGKSVETVDAITNSDIAISKGTITNQYEQHYAVGNDGINYVLVSFNNDPSRDPQSRVTSVKLVMTDRTVVDAK